VVFPLVDNGALVSRGTNQLKVEDFLPAIYVKDVFTKIFAAHGIRLQGELLNDVNYLSAITLSTAKNKALIDANSTHAVKTSTTTRPVENTDYKVTFDNDSTYPAFDGGNFNLATSTYTAPVKMRIDVTVSLKPQIVDSSYNNRIYLYINGVFTFVDIGLDSGGLYNSGTAGDNEIFTLKRSILLNAGDTLEVYSDWQQSTGSTANSILSGSVTITPTFIYYSSGEGIVPDWTQQEYVSQVLRLFNVIPSYNAARKVLTLNLFEKVSEKPSVDISRYISSTEVDYVEFINAYGKKNYMFFQEIEPSEDFLKLNLNVDKYAKGSIEVNNGYLADTQNVIESGFTNPITYVNPILSMSMEKTDLIRLEAGESTDVTSVVSGTLGRARFNIEEDKFLISDLVRIEESTNADYNGDWLVFNRGTGWVEVYGIPFDTDAKAKITKLTFTYSETDSVFIMHNVPNYAVTNFSGNTELRLEATDYETMAPAFFNLKNTGKPINQDFRYSMSFAEGDYQMTLVEQYFKLMGRVLNDPVKLRCEAYLPLTVYNQLDMLSPVRVVTEETQNRYYLNKISGYKESFYSCLLELIKLP
jgi:hypothetical protein